MIIQIPLHISGFWIPYLKPHPRLSGSVGAGITLYPMVEAKIPAARTTLNGENLDFRPAKTIADYLGISHVNAEIKAPVGLGQGFGLSAAVSIALAADGLLKKGVKVIPQSVGAVAHYAEVTNMTGLGDVIAELRGGGLVFRTKPGPLGIGEVEIASAVENVEVVTVVLGTMTTPEMLRIYAHKLLTYGKEAYAYFIKKPDLVTFLEASRMFSRKTGMLSKEIESKINELAKHELRDGGIMGYFVKKNLLVLVTQNGLGGEVAELVSPLGKARIFRLCTQGTVVKE